MGVKRQTECFMVNLNRENNFTFLFIGKPIGGISVSMKLVDACCFQSLLVPMEIPLGFFFHSNIPMLMELSSHS